MEHDSHHIIPFKTYLHILLALLFLTIVTVLVAKPVSGFDAGFLNAFIAMLIASVKAGLVAAFFMHLKYDNKMHLGLFIISIFFLVVLFAFSWFDIITRIQQFSTL
ncbi:MAG: cytochrome C oxidase subunit IV family protein [Bdellovibrionales bacterium]|nr:cytochrome C oxidase subunit IV family protein [Bdellovibrionales bacterium]